MKLWTRIRRMFAARAPSTPPNVIYTHDREATRKIIAESSRLNRTARHVAERATKHRDLLTYMQPPEERSP